MELLSNGYEFLAKKVLLFFYKLLRNLKAGIWNWDKNHNAEKSLSSITPV